MVEELTRKIRLGFFDIAYLGDPPWDIGRPQREIVKLAQAGEIKGDVLDVGCGIGENAFFSRNSDMKFGAETYLHAPSKRLRLKPNSTG